MGIELSNPILQNSEPIQKFLAYLALYGVILVLFRQFVWPIIAGIIERGLLLHGIRIVLFRLIYLALALLLVVIALFSILTITGGEFTVDTTGLSQLSLPDLTSLFSQIDWLGLLSAGILFLAILFFVTRVRRARREKPEELPEET